MRLRETEFLHMIISRKYVFSVSLDFLFILRFSLTLEKIKIETLEKIVYQL